MTSCRPLLPPLRPLTVLERRGAYLLCSHANDGCVRLHRHAVFVVERQSLWDAAHNLALLPTDVWMSTPVGQALARSPIVAASREVTLPFLLSCKLVWVALRTSTLAGVSGLQALVGTVWHEGSQSLIGVPNNKQHDVSRVVQL